MQPVSDLIALVSQQLGDIAQSDVVLGEPIALGEVTLVPLSRVSIGFAGGGGSGEGEQPRQRGPRHRMHHGGGGRGRGAGGSAGGGGRVRPVGVIVFGPDGVELKPIELKRGVIDTLFDKVPGLIERVQGLMDRDGGGETASDAGE